jgi:hygromycin-B 7''-O-kinase
MSEATVYSPRLGAISDAQFQAVADRLNLGRFLQAAATTSGLFGQNVFVTTTEGEFVLRGAPHWVMGPADTEHRPEDRWQFTKERFFAQQLHERAGVPTPWPMLHDQTSDILGWPYLVMPRMPGHCFNEQDIMQALGPEDRRGVAVAMAAMLAQMQQLTSSFAGDFDVDTIQLTPYPGGNTQYVVDQTRRHAAAAQAKGVITAEDIGWIDEVAALAMAAGERPNSYVHCDYKLNNLTVSNTEDGWRVTGLFDLHEAHFADGALDIVRQACSYLDTERELAGVFVRAYLERVAPEPRLAAFLPLYILNDRMKFWGFFAPEAPDWLKGRTFRQWAQRYVDKLLALL